MFSKYRGLFISIFSTLFILLIFQCGTNITAPFITVSNKNLTGLSQLINLFGGGGLTKASLFAVGISPYITAQIIIQMLSNDIIKPLSELKKMGESGRYKLELYTRLLTFPFAIMTSLGTFHLLSANNINFKDFSGAEINNFGGLSIIQQSCMILLFISGTYITLFLSDMISKKGIGNGVTLIIMSGIISSLPENFISAFVFFSTDTTVLEKHKLFINIFKFIIYIFFYLIVLLLIIFINGSVRKIPLQQIGDGMILNKNKLSYIPIKLMPAGIMPVIFAGSMMTFPIGVGELLKNKLPYFSEIVFNYFSFNSFSGLGIYFFLIVFFSFFYSKIQLNIEEMSKNFQLNSKFIPGIMIGQQTYNYLNIVVNRVNCLGAPFLAFVTIMPNLLNIFAGFPPTMTLGGTGIIIMVSGTLQVYEDIRSNYIINKYKMKINLENKNFATNNEKNIKLDTLIW